MSHIILYYNRRFHDAESRESNEVKQSNKKESRIIIIFILQKGKARQLSDHQAQVSKAAEPCKVDKDYTTS